MAYTMDPEVGAALAPFIALVGSSEPPPKGDWKALREMGKGLIDYWASNALSHPDLQDVKTQTYSTKAPDGTMISMRWYTKNGSAPGSAVVYAHGGGMIAGSVEQFDWTFREYVHETGVPFLAVDYRLAPEVSGKTLTEDVFAGLQWLIAEAATLGVDPQRIAVMGDSAGGGLAAGAAILAREREVFLAQQILIYPMLDDRNLEPDNARLPFLTWNYENNFTGWSALLGDNLGTDRVSPIAAPARLKEFKRLAPTYMEVGDLDIFRDEDLSYAQRLASASVPLELHVRHAAPHVFELFAPASKLAKRAMKDRFRVIKSL